MGVDKEIEVGVCKSTDYKLTGHLSCQNGTRFDLVISVLCYRRE